MKKLLTALLISLVFLPFMAKSVSAQIKEVDQKVAGLEYTLSTSQPTQEAFGTNNWKGMQSDTILSIFGGYPEKGAVKGANDEITYSRGMVGEMTRVMAWMLNSPPATTERYVADVLDSAGIATPAYAQGLGFASLDPILNTWKTFRNMAYLLFVVVFMVIGFLIMMRQKVGGQTVVTAQQAIPHIIIALLLVTFSYAIAGLLIDMMYLVMYLLLALFDKDQESFLNKNFLSLGWVMVSNGTTAAYQAVQEFGESMQTSLTQFGQEAVTFLGSLTLAVVVAIAITLKIFELFFELLKTYVTIVLTIAFSPVILAMGALPGKDSFKQWMLDLVGNLAAFPTVLLVLIVFDELTGGISNTPPVIEKGGFQPPYLFGTGAAGVMPFIIGVGMLMIMPEIVKEAKKMLGAKEGIFQQLARDIGQSAKKGWEGGEIIPGLGFTDTRKLPYGGLSGENFAKKQVSVGAGAVGGGYHAFRRAQKYQLPKDMYSPKEALKKTVGAAWGGFKAGGADGMARGAMAVDDDTVFTKEQKRIEEEKNK
jgi:hypothetical protein